MCVRMTHNNCELVKIDMMPEECPNELQSGPKCFSSVNEDRVVHLFSRCPWSYKKGLYEPWTGQSGHYGDSKED